MLTAIAMQTHCEACPEPHLSALKGSKEIGVSLTHESFKSYSLYIKERQEGLSVPWMIVIIVIIILSNL